MSQPDFRGARGSNAGDDFHELWVLKQALKLLDHDTDLDAITVEGLRPEDEQEQPEEAFDGVDCAMFYKGSTASTAQRIEIVQLKYSASTPKNSWTTSRLTQSSAKTRNNSVIRRLADAFRGLREQRNGSPDGISVHLVSNQPIHEVATQLVGDIVSGRPLTPGARKEKARIERASGFSGEALREFLRALDFTCTGSRFLIEEHVVKTISGWAEGDARALTNDVLRLVHNKMTPESKGESITRESILLQLGFSKLGAIFPCPPDLAPVPHIISREISKHIVDGLITGEKYLCLHGQAGCGKTTTVLDVERQLPFGSVMIIFDCYGGGRYLDSDAYRHKAKSAFLQLSNDLASRLHVPLLLTNSGEVDYPRAFHERLQRAAEVVRGFGEDALLVVAVDAADNAVAAGQRMVPREGSFISDFVRLGKLPDNVRLLVTARTGRLNQLDLPAHFRQYEITGFTERETAEYVRCTWNDAPDEWISEFHLLSNQNPRVQQYALEWAGEEPFRAREVLLPIGKKLDDVFDDQFDRARKKAGTVDPLLKFSAAASALPHPAPLGDLAVVCGLSEAEVRDICADLFGIRLIDGNIGFVDEEFENFIHSKGSRLIEEVQPKVADRFLANMVSDQYAATHLVSALYAAHRKQEILRVVENEPEPKCIVDPILRREVRLNRLRVAMQVCTETGDKAAMLRILLAGAEAMHGIEAIRNLVLQFPDLAAAFMQGSAVRMVLHDSRLLEHHGALLFHLYYERALQNDRISALSEYRQLNAWIERRRERDDSRRKGIPVSRQTWRISAIDLAAEIHGILLLKGPRAAVKALKRWRPHTIKPEVIQIVVQRLILSGQADVLKECLAQDLVKSPWNLFLLVPLALAGHSVDLEALMNALSRVQRRRWINIEELASAQHKEVRVLWLNTVLTAAEVFVGKGGNWDRINSLLEAFANASLRQVNTLHTFYSALIDLQLRAVALLKRIDGQVLRIEDFLIDPPKPTNVESLDSIKENKEQLHRLIHPLIPLYDIRAQILTNVVPVYDFALILNPTIGPPAHADHLFSRIHGSPELSRRTAIAVASLCFLPRCDLRVLIRHCRQILGTSRDHFDVNELAILSTFALRAECHGEVLQLLEQSAQAIASRRSLASQKTESLLEITRTVAQISRDDASAIFAIAHQTAEEADLEERHRLRALAAIATRSAITLNTLERRHVAQRLYSIITDSSVRIGDEEGFPWTDLVETLTTLDLPAALACVGRWQDLNRLDLDSSLSTIIHTGIAQRLLSVSKGVSLLPLLGATSKTLLTSLLPGVKELPPTKQISLLNELAKEAVLDSSTGRECSGVELLTEALPAGAVSGPWLGYLHATKSFIRDLDRSSSPPMERRKAPSLGRAIGETPSSARLVDALKSPEGIVQLFEEENAKARATSETDADLPSDWRFVSAESLLEAIRKAAPANKRITFLKSVAGLPSGRIHESAVAESLLKAVDEWKSSFGVRAWCRDHLPGVVTDRLPALSAYLGYSNASKLIPLVDVLAAERVDVATVLATGISRHVEKLSAVAVYELASLIAQRVEPADAAVVMTPYLERLIARISDEHIDQINISDVPADFDAAIARFLFALMSDCDVPTRWRAAHTIRRIARLGETKVLNAFLTVYDRTNDNVFRAANEPFYWMAARLWWNITICRLAHESPQAILSFGPKLIEIAEDESFPHVLARAFAKEAAFALIKGGELKLSSTQLKTLSSANTVRLPKRSGRRSYGRRPIDQRERAFPFDSTDTIPYWYQPALEMFADLPQERFLDVVENWIVNRWNIGAQGSRYELKTRTPRFTGRDWRDSAHRHGSEPTLEPFATYLERHALFCAIGELLQSCTFRQEDMDDYYSYEGWLQRRGLECPPFWLADLRGPIPLERRFWAEPTGEIDEWVNGAAEADFITELGTQYRAGKVVVSANHTIGVSRHFTKADIHSALVEPSTAAALMRAFQAAEDPYSFRLPDEDDGDFTIDSPPYRLLGWLRDRTAKHSGIDRKDPLRNSIAGLASVPGNLASKDLTEGVSLKGWPVWRTKVGTVGFELEAWSTNPDTKSRQYLREFESHGERLWVSAGHLRNVLNEAKMDLIVSITLLRRERNTEYAGGESKEKVNCKGKVVLLRRNGEIEDACGRIGTW